MDVSYETVLYKFLVVSKPSLATDKDIQDLEHKFSGELGINIDKEKAKLIRRKNFVDFCREAVYTK